jgi:uncharacterized protein (TIGR00251 family)
VTDSTRLRLRVAPGTSHAGVVGRHGDGWKVRVAAPPEHGRANDAVVSLLADALDLSRRDVAIVAGHRGRDKVVSLAGIGPEEAERRLLRVAFPAGTGKRTA